MLDDEELERLLLDLESDRCERKSAPTDSDKIQEAICAFANDLPDSREPGVVFIGVDDRGGCVNLPVTDKLLLKLADFRSAGNILPLPALVVQKRTLRGCTLAVIIVEPADAPPVRFKGVPWIRVGPRRGRASQEEERRLAEKRRWKDQPFDLHPVWSGTLGHLDLSAFQTDYLPSAVAPEILQENRRTLDEQLGALRFATTETPPVPTVLGLLVVGRSPTDFLPGAYIQFVRFEGTTLTDPIKHQRELRGPLPQVLRELDDVLGLNIGTRTTVTESNVEQQFPDYPLVALQQVARNGVMHRSYEGTHAPTKIFWFSDRVEVLSPGGPFGAVNRQNFGIAGIADYRNPNLAEAMKNLGYVQKFGLGIALTRQEMKKNGNPAPEFVAEDTYILVTLRARA